MNLTAALMRIIAGVFLALPLLYNELTFRLLYSGRPLEPHMVAGIRGAQAGFLIIGLALFTIATIINRFGPLSRFSSKPAVASLVLSLAVFLVPIVIVELALRPFSVDRKKTTIFVQDPELGWKLRPDHQGTWGEVAVSINAKGLRGPEIPYERTPGSLRVLYLGDSVTFGYRLPTYESTFPHRIEERLEADFGVEVETINSGVGGYSPWQELLFLETEGLRYRPDLVVLSFVLNDVTEKFHLQRFGGNQVGFQLAHSATSLFDRFATKSAIVYAIRQWRARTRFGDDLQEGAVEREKLNDWALIQDPDSPRIQQAWNLTIENLDKIVRVCKRQEISLLILAFPSTYQFSDVERSGLPQKIVVEFGSARGVPTIDLLRRLVQAAEESHESPFDYFLDENHPSEKGSSVIASLVAPAVAELLTAAEETTD